MIRKVTPHRGPSVVAGGGMFDEESDEEVVDPFEFEALSQATVRCE
jgi:hypothetical protein